MGWLHSAPSQQAQPVAAASAGIPFGVRNGSGKSARSISSYGNYSTAGYPSMAATAENVALASIGRCAENAAVAYGMAPPLTTIPLPLPQSPSTSSASSSPHDYNHNHNHSHSHSHSHSHNHHRNPYAYMVAANMSPQQSSSLYMAHAEYPPMTANSNRMMRNLAEKMRRDKLNTYIGELSTLVPMVSNSPKKMDKTSVLRLATTFLRMHRVTEATRDQRNMLPHIFNSSEWPQSLLDKMDGVMLIVTSAGKIVFISHNIEKVLGHTQTELMGHGLSNITFPPDLPELRRCLTPDKEDENCSDNVGANTNTNTNTNNTNANANANTNTNTNNCTLVERQRRSVCLRLRHRCLARSEQPQYEPMHLNGFLRVPKKYTCQAQKKSRKCKGEMVATNSNEILLVAVMKPAREMTLMSIVEASQEEYVTRHWYDGRIIFCDQRISLVSGYLPDEVKGLQAFLFMAKEEVHWVMIALRQMLWNREGFGKSCYRLKRKNGEFIYLVTHGYLEPCEDLHKSTFVCVNTLVSSEEGEREIRNMKRKFTPIIERKEEPAIAAIAEKYTFVNLQDRRNEDDYTPSTEDPAELKTALKAMVTNIPAPVEVKEDPDKCRDTQFAKVKYISKTLPPPTIPGSKLITVVEEKTATTTTTMTTMTTMTALTTSSMSPSPSSPSSSPSLSPSPSTSFSSKLDRLSPSLTNVATSTAAATTIIGGASSPQPHAMAVSPSATASSRTAFQNRPSVLRIAPARQAAVNASPVTASTDSYSISSTSNFDSEAVAIGDIAPRKYSASFSRAAEYAVQPSPSNCDFVKQECRIKQETIDVDDGDGDDDDDDDDDNEEEQENNGGNNNDEDDDDDDDLEAQFAAAMQADSCQQLAAAVAAAAATVAANAVENERAGVVVSGRSAVKRHLHCDGSSFGSSVVPIKKNANFADGANNHQHQQNYGLATAIAPSLSPHQVSSSSSASALSSSYAVHRNNAQYSTATVSALNSSNLHLETTDVSQMDDSYTQLAGIEMCDPTSRFVHDITNSFEAKGKPEDVLQLLDNENLKHHHIELESKMHIQGAQINAIEGDLNKVPFTSEQLGFQTDLTHLKEQHVKQKKLLMTLQQDHHSLQHCNAPDAMGISSTLHQNVGV